MTTFRSTRLLILLGMAVFGAAAAAHAQRSVGLLPGDKQPVPIRPEERNPFAKREQKPEIVQDEQEAETEENRIRNVLMQLRVVGRTRGSEGRKILLDDLILEAGKILPPVIAGQTERLKVEAIYESAIEIVWIEADPAAEPRRLFIPVNLQPGVSRALGGRSVNPPVPQPSVTTDAPVPPTEAPADL